MGRLDSKVAVITGATSGIGLRIMEVFVAEGAKIVIAAGRIPEGEALIVLATRSIREHSSGQRCRRVGYTAAAQSAGAGVTHQICYRGD